MRESYIEKKVCEYAKTKGWLNLKFVSPSNGGVPDRMFLRNGKLFFIEFKSATGKLSPIQIAQHRRLLSAGFPVYVCNDIQKGRDFFDSL